MRSTSKNLRTPFSQLEQAVMNAVWRRRSATADQVRADLEPQRVLKDSTIRTVLKRLEEKGHLKHNVEGRTYVYSSAEPPQNLAIRAVRQIIERFCSGSVEQLVVGMVDQKVLNPDELRRLAQKIATAEGKKRERT
jgi:predicted transcriptional regulator